MKIEFSNKKNLVLNNVLCRNVPTNEFLSQDKYIHQMKNWISAKGYIAIGPLIMYSNSVVGMQNIAKTTIDSKILIQLNPNKEFAVGYPYKYEEKIKVENCLFARFNDNANNFSFATMELKLYAYKNDIELVGDTYTVLVEQEENNILADLFMPVKQ